MSETQRAMNRGVLYHCLTVQPWEQLAPTATARYHRGTHVKMLIGSSRKDPNVRLYAIKLRGCVWRDIHFVTSEGDCVDKTSITDAKEGFDLHFRYWDTPDRSFLFFDINSLTNVVWCEISEALRI